MSLCWKKKTESHCTKAPLWRISPSISAYFILKNSKKPFLSLQIKTYQSRKQTTFPATRLACYSKIHCWEPTPADYPATCRLMPNTVLKLICKWIVTKIVNQRRPRNSRERKYGERRKRRARAGVFLDSQYDVTCKHQRMKEIWKFELETM